MVRLEVEVWKVRGEDSWKFGEETSGNENVSYERGSESDLSRVFEVFN